MFLAGAANAAMAAIFQRVPLLLLPLLPAPAVHCLSVSAKLPRPPRTQSLARGTPHATPTVPHPALSATRTRCAEVNKHFPSLRSLKAMQFIFIIVPAAACPSKCSTYTYYPLMASAMSK
jgi:hypothetical protein